MLVYISEAHAADEWPLNNIYSIEQHKDLDQRIKAANNFKKEFISNSYEIYIDSLDKYKSFEYYFSGWPERGFIVKDWKIEYIAFGVIEGIVDWHTEIDQYLKNNKIE